MNDSQVPINIITYTLHFKHNSTKQNLEERAVRGCGLLEAQFEEVAYACLALLVDQILALREAAAGEGSLCDGRALGHAHLPPLHLDACVQLGVCRGDIIM